METSEPLTAAWSFDAVLDALGDEGYDAFWPAPVPPEDPADDDEADDGLDFASFRPRWWAGPVD